MVTEKQRNSSAIRGQENNREAVWAILIAAENTGINAPEAATESPSSLMSSVRGASAAARMRGGT